MLRVSLSEFYNMTLRELQNAIKGFLEHEERTQRIEWERTRWQTAILVNIQLPKNKSIKPQELARFPWEVKKPNKGVSKLTEEQIKARLDKWQKA